MHVSGHTATIRSSVTANMNLIGERYLYMVIVCSVTGPLTVSHYTDIARHQSQDVKALKCCSLYCYSNLLIPCRNYYHKLPRK